MKKENIKVYTKIIAENERGIFLGESYNKSHFWIAIAFLAMAIFCLWFRNLAMDDYIGIKYWVFTFGLFGFSFLGLIFVVAAFIWDRNDFLKLYWKENSFVICEVSKKKQNCEIVLLEKIIDFSWDAQKALTLTYLNDEGTNQKIEISLKKKINDSSFAYINRKMFDAVKLNK